MKIYLDMCCLKRPFDDRSHTRVHLEAVATEAILDLCDKGTCKLMSSDALHFENDRNPNEQRRDFAAKSLARAVDHVRHSTGLEQRAQVWQNAGVGLLDALHLASAEAADADAFATCDDELLRRAGRVGSNVRVIALLELFRELSP